MKQVVEHLELRQNNFTKWLYCVQKNSRMTIDDHSAE